MLRRKVAGQLNRLPKSTEGSEGGDTKEIHKASSLPLHYHQQQQKQQSHVFNAPDPSLSNNGLQQQSIGSSKSTTSNKNTMKCFLVQFLCYICIGYLMISYSFESNQLSIDDIDIISTTSDNSIKNMKDEIIKQMKLNLNAMPSPEWPQIDHRIAEAMTSSGVILGVENHNEFNFNHTIGE